MGHRSIWFHRAHIFTSHWLCARTMLNVRSADMNQTWPLDFSFKSGGRRAKKTKYKDTHILSENWGRGGWGGGGEGVGQALRAKEVCRGGEGHSKQRKWHKQGPILTRGTKEMAISLNRWCQYFLKCGPQMPPTSITWDSCYRCRLLGRSQSHNSVFKVYYF